VRVIPGFQNVELIVNQQGDLDGNPFALDREEMQLQPPTLSRFWQQAPIKGQPIRSIQDGGAGLAFPGRGLSQKGFIKRTAQLLSACDDFMAHLTDSVQSFGAPAEIGQMLFRQRFGVAVPRLINRNERTVR
jgi:hypothetical protein